MQKLRDGTKIHPFVLYKQMSFIERVRTLLTERRTVFSLHPNLMVQDGVSTP
jgi:hypothetical protein